MYSNNQRTLNILNTLRTRSRAVMHQLWVTDQKVAGSSPQHCQAATVGSLSKVFNPLHPMWGAVWLLTNKKRMRKNEFHCAVMYKIFFFVWELSITPTTDPKLLKCNIFIRSGVIEWRYPHSSITSSIKVTLLRSLECKYLHAAKPSLQNAYKKQFHF